MFARNVSMHLKPNTAGEFTRTLERDIVPLLKQESADAYSRNGYAEVLKGLSRVVEGTPVVRTYEVSNSTFHTIPAHI
jgi:hypothetical protein